MEFIKTPTRHLAFERDAFGYPRVFARTREEAAFAQGFLHATDRMMQTHLLLFIARGRIMEFVGDRPLYRQLDHSMRRLDVERDTEREVQRLNPRTRAIFEQYCEGFNWAAAKAQPPLLMRLLGIPVEKMTPHLILLIHRQAAYLGLASLQEHAEELILDLAKEGMSPALFELMLGDAAKNFDPRAVKDAIAPRPIPSLKTTPGTGSSAWAVSGKKTKSGAALLACDFHLQIGTFPPSGYMFHLEINGEDFLQGSGLPGSPCLLAGRNRAVAWGATYANGDVFDIQLERCDKGHYEAAGKQVPLIRREEVVKIRGKQSETWVFWENAYGVIDQDASKPGIYPCIRWSGARGHDADSLNAFLGVEEEATASGAARLLSRVRTASIHHVLADKDGHIAYTQSGAVDQRPEGWSGAYPRAAWRDASRNVEDLPQAAHPIMEDPVEGFLVSANEAVDGPNGERFSCLPHPDYRARQLRKLLSEKETFDKEDMKRFAYNTVDLAAITLLTSWKDYLPKDPEAAAMLAWVKDGVPLQSTEDYQRLSRFYAMHRAAIRILLVPHLGAARSRQFVEEGELFVVFQHHLDEALCLKKRHLLDEDKLREIVLRAWEESKHTAKDFPMPMRAVFKNFLLDGRLPAPLGFDSKEITLPGNPHCAFQLRELQLGDMKVLVGPLFHLVFDMSERGGWYNIAGGASEDRLGPGYGLGLGEWRDGVWAPLGYV